MKFQRRKYQTNCFQNSGDFENTSSYSLVAKSRVYLNLTLSLLIAVGDPAFIEAVRGQLDFYAIARHYLDVVHPHLAGDMA